MENRFTRRRQFVKHISAAVLLGLTSALFLPAPALAASGKRDFDHALRAYDRLLAETDAHEGPVYVADEDALYFTTVRRGQVAIKRLSLADGRVSVIREDANMANGMTLDREGRLVICEQGSLIDPARITRFDRRRRTVETLVEGSLNSPNDVVVRSDGTIWFTDPSYGGTKTQPGEYVFRIAPGGNVSTVDTTLTRPNGITLSPDEKTLYVADEPNDKIVRYTVNTDGTTSDWVTVKATGVAPKDTRNAEVAAALARERGEFGTLADALGFRAVQLAFAQRFHEASVAATEALQLAQDLRAENLEFLPRGALTMGIFDRLSSLLRSNINDLISRAEDPQKMLNQIVVDMQNQLVEAKKQVAVSIADQKRLEKQRDEQGELSKEWERKAMLAVRAGDDNLAREALRRKTEHDNQLGEFAKQADAQKVAVDKLKEQLRTLNDKIEEAKRKAAAARAAGATSCSTACGRSCSPPRCGSARSASRGGRSPIPARAAWRSRCSMMSMPVSCAIASRRVRRRHGTAKLISPAKPTASATAPTSSSSLRAASL